MHITFLMPHHWSSTLGGAELQVRYFIEHIRRHSHHKVSMICCNTRMHNDEGVTVHESRAWLPIRRYSLISDYPSIYSRLVRLEPDVVYTRTCTPLVGFAASYCERHGKALVYHIAHVEDVCPPRETGRRAFLKKLHRPIYIYGLKRARVIVAQAPYQSAALLQNYGLRASAVIPNFHPIPDLRGLHKRGNVVLWVANLKPAKQPEVFLGLAKRFSQENSSQFIMVGAIQDSAYEHFRDQSTLPRNVSYLGIQTVDAVNQLFASADILVNTSRADGEGFPNTFIQAWLHKVPVLSLEMNPDSILTARGLGRCCDGDFEHLVDALARLLQNEMDRIEIGRTAREYAAANFSEANCKFLLNLIESNVP